MVAQDETAFVFGASSGVVVTYQDCRRRGLQMHFNLPR
jgi:hypothetical protein